MIKFRHIGFILLILAYGASVAMVVVRTTRESADDRIVIRLSHWQLEGTVRNALDEIIKRYEATHPKVHVVQIPVPGPFTYPAWVQTQMIGGKGPDIAEYSWVWPDIPQHFQPLTEDVLKPNPYNRGTALENVSWRDTFVDALDTDEAFIKALNQYYAVTMTSHIPRFVYNRDLLKKITGRETPPATYRELLELDRQVRAYGEAHKTPLVTLANSGDSAIMLEDTFLGVVGGKLADRLAISHRLAFTRYELAQSFLRGEWSYYSPEMKAGFEVMKSFGDISTPGFVQRLRDSALTDFVNGNALMMMAPSWEASSLMQICPFALGAFRFPYPMPDDPVYGKYIIGTPSEGRRDTGMPFYVSRETKHRAEVIDFLQFMTSQQGSQIFTNVSNWQPAIRGVKPSAFAEQFTWVTDGFTYGSNASFSFGSGVETRFFVMRSMYKIWGAGGSVAAMQEELQRAMPGKILEDFEREERLTLQNIRREDTAATAAVMLKPPGQRPALLPLMSMTNEAMLYQIRESLETPPPARP